MSRAENAGRVVIGSDPHKRSATIEVMTGEEAIVGGGRFATDPEGYADMGGHASQWPNRVWAIEDCAGIGKTHRGPAPGRRRSRRRRAAKAVGRARVFATGQSRKTDATDTHSVALVGTRMSGRRPVVTDDHLEVLRLLVDLHRSLGEEHTRKTCQLHGLLLD